MLETSHPPTIYIPPDDVQLSLLAPSDAGTTWCEFKGADEDLRDHIAFYPRPVDAAWLDDERVQAQPGDFYGGWITSDLIGPFKGPPGTRGW